MDFSKSQAVTYTGKVVTLGISAKDVETTDH